MKWASAGLLLVLILAAIYFRSSKSVDGQKAYDDGVQMLKANRYPEAIEALDRSITIKPNSPEAYLVRGRANVSLNQLEAAIRDFTKVIELRPKRADVLLER